MSNSWDDMTREERVALLLEDPEAYVDLVPEKYWLMVLDGMAGLTPIEPD